MPIVPIPPPTDDVASLGPDKRDRDLPVDPQTHLSAKEWNQMKTYVKWAYDSIQVLSLTGSVGTLHNAYANAAGGANVLPTRIFADINVGGVVFTNHASPLSTLLLGVSDSAGNNEHGLYADGLRLHGGPNSIRSNTANPIQMKSGALIGPAYILNVNAPLIASNSLFELRNGGGTTLTAYCNGDLAGHHALTATKVWKIEAAYDGTGMVRWKSDQSGGVSHCPHAPGVGTLGRFDEAWGGVFSRFAAITKRTYPYSPSVDIDLHLASYHESAGLSGDIGIASVLNAEVGAMLRLAFIQDGTGGRKLTSLPPNFKLRYPFTLSTPPNSVDYLHLFYDGVAWVEVSRNQARPPEEDVANVDISAGGTKLLFPHVDAHTRRLFGTLAANAAIDLKTTAAVRGDRYLFIFDDALGVTTDPAKTFTFAVDAVAVQVYNQAKTLRGIAMAVFDGATWRYSLSSLSYA